MDLRRFLFDTRISQSAIARKSNELGIRVHVADVNRFVHGRIDWGHVARAIRLGLEGLGVAPAQIDRIKELKNMDRPGPGPRPGSKRKASNGKS